MTTAVVREVLRTLERAGSKARRDGLARYGITATTAYGVPMPTIQRHAKALGRDAALADALWCTGVYDARLLAAFVGDPARTTVATMDRWCRDFDSWAVCDTACFHLFDRTPLALGRVTVWARRTGEFQRRAAFALLASVALHRKDLPDAALARHLPTIAAAADDERNFVKKAVSWALRGLGARSRPLHAAALALGDELAASTNATRRWIGRDAVRDLRRPLVMKRLMDRL